MDRTYRVDALKRYSLEFYGRGQPANLIWKVDADEPFAPMGRGDRILPMDAPGVRSDSIFEIVAIEHLLWSAGEKVRYVTRVYIEPAEPIA